MVAPTPLVPAGIGPVFPATASGAAPPGISPEKNGTPLWGEDGFTFGDLIDLVNPLHHIPVVSWAYRAITGDQIAPGAMALGGGLFGGVAGLALGIVDAVIQGTTGKDTGAHLLAMLQQDRGPDLAPANTPIAAANPGTDVPTRLPDRAPILTPDEVAVLLASTAPAAQARAKNPGAIAAFGGLAATAHLNPLFLPLVPIGHAGPDDEPRPEGDRGAPAVRPADPAGGKLPRDQALVTAAVDAGAEIRALFGLN